MNSEFERKVNKVPHLFTENHAHLIYGLIRWLRPQICVEVGAFHGFTSLVMSRALEDSGEDGLVFAIDDFSLGNSATSIHNHAQNLGLANSIIVSPGDSSDESIWPDRVDFCFIDGNHSYKGVVKDFSIAVSRGATCIVIHDTVGWWGPKKFLEECLSDPGILKEWGILNVPFDSGFAVFLRHFSSKDIMPQYTEQEYPKGVV